MSKRRQHPSTERELCAAVGAALQELGWLVPTTPAAVAVAEARLAEQISQAPTQPPPPMAPAPEAPAETRLLPLSREPGPVEETLARAAREGGPLSPEVEEAMRRDRAAAEAELRRRQPGATEP